MSTDGIISLVVAVVMSALSIAYTAGGVLPRLTRLEKDVEGKVSVDRFDDLYQRLTSIESKLDAMMAARR